MSSKGGGQSGEPGTVTAIPSPLLSEERLEAIRPAVGRSRTACTACRLARRFCDRAAPCSRCERMGLTCMPVLEREGKPTRKRPLPVSESEHGGTVAGGLAPPILYQPLATDEHWELPAISAEDEEWAPPVFAVPRGHMVVEGDFVSATSASFGPSGPYVHAPTGGGGDPNPINFSAPGESLWRPISVASGMSEPLTGWSAWEEAARQFSVPRGGGVESVKRGRGDGDEVVSIQLAPPYGRRDVTQDRRQEPGGLLAMGEGEEGGQQEKIDAESPNGVDLMEGRQLTGHRPVGDKEPMEVAFEAACRATTTLSLEGKVNVGQARMPLTGLEASFIAGGSGFAYPPFLSVLRQCVSRAEPQSRAPASSPPASTSASAPTATAFLVDHAMIMAGAVADPHYSPPPWDPSAPGHGVRGMGATAGHVDYLPSAGGPRELCTHPATSVLAGQGRGDGGGYCSHRATSHDHHKPTSEMHVGGQRIIPEASWIDQLWDDPSAGACSFALVLIDSQPITSVRTNALMAEQFADESDLSTMCDQLRTFPTMLLARFMTPASSITFYTLLSKNICCSCGEDACAVEMINRRGLMIRCTATVRWHYGPGHSIVGARFTPVTSQPETLVGPAPSCPPSSPSTSPVAAAGDERDVGFTQLGAAVLHKAASSASTASDSTVPHAVPSALPQGLAAVPSRPQPPLFCEPWPFASPPASTSGHGEPSHSTQRPPPTSRPPMPSSPATRSAASLLLSLTRSSSSRSASASTRLSPSKVPGRPPSTSSSHAPPPPSSDSAPSAHEPPSGDPSLPYLPSTVDHSITGVPDPEPGNGGQGAPSLLLDKDEVTLLWEAVL